MIRFLWTNKWWSWSWRASCGCFLGTHETGRDPIAALLSDCLESGNDFRRIRLTQRHSVDRHQLSAIGIEAVNRRVVMPGDEIVFHGGGHQFLAMHWRHRTAVPVDRDALGPETLPEKNKAH